MIQVNGRAKRGAILSTLRRLIVDEAVGAAAPDQIAVLSRGREAVARIIQEAAAGSEVHVQMTADADPLGGWSASVLVNVIPARARDGRPKRGRSSA